MWWQRFRDYGTSFHCTLLSLSQYQQTWLLSRLHWDHCPWVGRMASTMQGNCFFTLGTRTSHTSLPAPGDSLCFLTRAPPDTQLWSFRLCATVLVNPGGVETLSVLPVSGFGEHISCSVPCKYFHSFLSFYPAALRRMFFLHSLPFSVLSTQNELPILCGFSLPQFTFPHHVPAVFCGSSCADCCVNSRISFLGVQDGLVLMWLPFRDETS